MRPVPRKTNKYGVRMSGHQTRMAKLNEGHRKRTAKINAGHRQRMHSKPQNDLNKPAFRNDVD